MKIYFINLKKAKIFLYWFLVLTLVSFLAGVSFGKVKKPVSAVAPPVYHGSLHDKEIAFTFNVVWGEEYLPDILKILRDNEVKATFFIGGSWAEKYSHLVRQIDNDGHEIGSHGYSHPHPDELTLEENVEEIKKAESVLESITGKKPVFFAPPYGEKGRAVLSAAEMLGYTTILWSIDTIDWQRPEPSLIVKRVLEKAHNGAIVLMHPTEPTVKALPYLISELKGMGYKLVTVSTVLN